MTTRKSELINELSKRGDRYGSVLIRFMEEYGLVRLSDATEEELQEFKNKIEKENKQ